jgi:hypothetical protein
MAGGLAWQASDGKLREHGSWRPGILSRRIEVRTSGTAACSVSERRRCGRLSRRASMMPILSRWGSAAIRHNIVQERQGQDVRDGCSSGAQDNSCVPAVPAVGRNATRRFWKLRGSALLHDLLPPPACALRLPGSLMPAGRLSSNAVVRSSICLMTLSCRARFDIA